MTGVDLNSVIVTPGDLIPPHCAWGLRHWWRLQGLDFKDFLKNGISAARLLATGDDLAKQAVDRKLEVLREQE